MKKLGLILFVFAFASCRNEADPEADKSFFTKFYDNNAFNIAYTPLDVAQTTDGGYIVLGLRHAMIDSTGIDPGTIYLMKTDEFGELVSAMELDEALGAPAPSLLSVNGKHYFFCMTNKDFTIQLIEITDDGIVALQTNVPGTYPLAAATDGDTLMLLSYDPAARNSVMSWVGTDGQASSSKTFSVGASDDGSYSPGHVIIDHVARTGPQLPFFVGKTEDGKYYFNGIYNYTLSTVLIDRSGDSPAGVIHGNQDKGGFSALYSIPGGKFAAARFNYGDNYLLPSIALPDAGSSAELGGNPFPELTPNAPVRIINAKINGVDRIIYGSDTRNKQIGLFGYNPADGKLIGTKYIGFSNSFEIASIIATSDEGLLVLGTTYIAGRFPRICLFKLSSEALGKSFQ